MMTTKRHLDHRLKFHLLRAVDAIERHRSLLKASVALGVSQPALTKSLHELEDILQLRLFDRFPRGMHPTDSGAVFVRSARTVVRAQIVKAAVRTAGGDGSRRPEPWRVSAPTEAART